jgi:hypothetical protein
MLFMPATRYLLNIFPVLRGRDQKKPLSESNFIASAAFKFNNMRHGGDGTLRTIGRALIFRLLLRCPVIFPR